jgi:hypothetical protein
MPITSSIIAGFGRAGYIEGTGGMTGCTDMLKQSLVLFGALALAAALAAPARADIRINISRFENGHLRIEGHTEPNAKVTLDGKYTTTSNSGGYFTFTESYKPSDCMSDIRSGEDVYSAVIAGCFGEFAIEHKQVVTPESQ